MYTSRWYRVEEREKILSFIETYSFATLISGALPEPAVSHLPLLLDRTDPGRERVLGHLARANPHSALLAAGGPVLMIFHGPHAYISPAWYQCAPAVPTWNYAVVHVYGKPSLLSAAETRILLDRLVEKHEAGRRHRWSGELPSDFMDRELSAIAGFEVRIERVEAKFKLGQNREAADREWTLAGLEQEPDAASRELARFTRRHLEPTSEPTS